MIPSVTSFTEQIHQVGELDFFFSFKKYFGIFRSSNKLN